MNTAISQAMTKEVLDGIPTLTFTQLEENRDRCNLFLKDPTLQEDHRQIEVERNLYVAAIIQRLCGECTGAGTMAGGVPCKICQAKGYIEPKTVKA